jgi:hypothetical protein
MEATMNSQRFRTLAALVTACLALSCGSGASGGPDTTGECDKDEACADGLDCTEDLCAVSVNGVRKCQHVARADRCAADEECLSDPAGPTGCVALAKVWCAGRAEGAACDPIDACATAKGTCQAGTCTYPTLACPALACQAALGCDRKTGACAYADEADGTACDLDDDPCTQDTCVSGDCMAGASDGCDCGPDKPCVDDGDKCNGVPECVNGTCVMPSDSVVTCTDTGNPCRPNACNPATGGCEVEHLSGPDCDADDDVCTTATCDAGECVVSAVACDDGNPCTKDACDPALGCVFAADDGASCSDGSVCTQDDRCLDKQCVGGSLLECPATAVCQAGTCDPVQGCVFKAMADCCGNGAVDGDEVCDQGVDGSAGCAGDCTFRAFELAGGAELGRGPAVAWSPATGTGVLMFEVVHADGSRELATRTIDADLAPGAAKVVQATELPSGSFGYVPTVTPVPGETGYLAAWFGLVQVDGSARDAVVVRRLDATGSVELAQAAKIPIDPDRVPGMRIALGANAIDVAAAWITGAANRSGERIDIASLKLSSVGVSDFQPVRISPPAGDDTVRKSHLGDLCAGPEGVLVTYAETVLGNPSMRLVFRVLPLDGPLTDPIHASQFDMDMAMPPRCAVRPEGGYLVVYPYVTNVGGSQSMQLWAQAVDKTGTPHGDARLLDSTAMASESGTCLPLWSALVPEASAFRYFCPFMMLVDGKAVASGPLRSLRVAADGALLDAFAPVPGTVLPFVLAVSGTPATGGSALVAWQEAEVVSSLTDLPASTVRATFTGSQQLPQE